MNYKREEIHSLVINYKETKDRVLLDSRSNTKNNL